MCLEGLRTIHEKCIDKAKQLHDSLVLMQVLMAFQEEHEVSTIAACVCVCVCVCVCAYENMG